MNDLNGNEIRLHDNGIVTVQNGERLEHIADFRFCQLDDSGNLVVWTSPDGSVCTLNLKLVDQRTR